jgi:hypothetical protein
MKMRLFASLLIGALMAAVFYAMPLTSPWLNFQFPGHAAAFVFWGMVSNSTSAGLLVASIVNAVLYAALVFVLLSVVLSVLRMAIDMTKR